MTRYEINYPMLRAFRRIWRPIELYLAASEEAEAILNNRVTDHERYFQSWMHAFWHCAERVARRYGLATGNLILQYDDALKVHEGYLIKARAMTSTNVRIVTPTVVSKYLH